MIPPRNPRDGSLQRFIPQSFLSADWNYQEQKRWSQDENDNRFHPEVKFSATTERVERGP
jgi:hypothetical protein